MSLDELRALEQAATPGPWLVDEREPCWVVAERDPQENIFQGYGDERGLADTALAVAARNALPGLLGRVAAAEAERDALLRAAEEYRELTTAHGFQAVAAARRLDAVLAASASGPAEPTTKETR